MGEPFVPSGSCPGVSAPSLSFVPILEGIYSGDAGCQRSRVRHVFVKVFVRRLEESLNDSERIIAKTAV